MTEKEKREFFNAEMVSKGVKKSELAPPLFRLLWAVGIRVPPPLYATGGQHLFVYGVMGGVFWGAFMWLFVWRDAPGIAIGGGFSFGLLFSFLMSFQVDKQRKALGIEGDWESYRSEARTTEVE